MKEKKVSIVVPCFNSQYTLVRLFNSLASQTYKNIEIILIDNNSTDKTLEVMRSLANKDNRIKIFTQSKGNASSARNAGIKKASGDYIVFADSDDFLFSESIEILVNTINEADMAFASVRRINSDKKYTISKIEEPFTSRERLLNSILVQNRTAQRYNPRNIWGKIYRTKYIRKNNILFNEKIDTFEDALFNFMLLKNTDIRLSFTNKETYNYVRNEGSLVKRKISNLEKQDRIKLSVLDDNSEYFSNSQKLIALLSLELFVDFIKKDSDISVEKIQYAATKGVYSTHLKKINFFKLSIKKKIIYILTRLHMYPLLLKIIRGAEA